jgi:hypothetical protein
MKKIKINDIELHIDDGVEITLDTEGTIKISTKLTKYWYYYPNQYPTITSTYPQTTPNIQYFSDKQILTG